jgi:hypothetical protein
VIGILSHKRNVNKTTLKFLYTPVRMTSNNKCWRGYKGKRNLHMLLVGMYTAVNTVEINMEVPQKPKMDLLYDPTIPFLGIGTKECKLICKIDTCILMYIAALFIRAKL